MSRLPQVPGHRIIRALMRLGFQVRRQRGGHAILVHGTDPTRRAVVPLDGGGATVPEGTLHQILKGAGVSEEEFREHL